MKANRVLLEKKYARIIVFLAERKDITVNEAMKVFYESTVYQMLASGIADLHCRSDYYIVDEILIEIEDKEQQKNKFINRMLAYEKALEKIRLEKE